MTVLCNNGANLNNIYNSSAFWLESGNLFLKSSNIFTLEFEVRLGARTFPLKVLGRRLLSQAKAGQRPRIGGEVTELSFNATRSWCGDEAILREISGRVKKGVLQQGGVNKKGRERTTFPPPILRRRTLSNSFFYGADRGRPVQNRGVRGCRVRESEEGPLPAGN